MKEGDRDKIRMGVGLIKSGLVFVLDKRRDGSAGED